MANWRKNQQDGEYVPKIFGGVNADISSEWEVHTVEYHEDGNFYGIIPEECPLASGSQPGTPASVRIDRRVGMSDTPLTEVSLEIDPSTGQFAVDYEGTGYEGTGRIFAPASEEGNTWVIKRYAGVGRIAKDPEGDTWEFQGITRQGRQVLPSPFKNVEYLSTETWVVPEGVDAVFVRVIGAGGGGGGGDTSAGGGGGGGGGVAEALLTGLTPGDEIDAVAGSGGAASIVGAAGGNGGDSSFSGPSSEGAFEVAAPGGFGGSPASGSTPGRGGRAPNYISYPADPFSGPGNFHTKGPGGHGTPNYGGVGASGEAFGSGDSVMFGAGGAGGDPTDPGGGGAPGVVEVYY